MDHSFYQIFKVSLEVHFLISLPPALPILPQTQNYIDLEIMIRITFLTFLSSFVGDNSQFSVAKMLKAIFDLITKTWYSDSHDAQGS